MRSFSLDEVIEQTRQMGGVLITTETATAIKNVFNTITRNAGMGFGFYSPYFTVSFSIQGTFTDDDDTFDPNRHKVMVNINPSVQFRNQLAKIAAERTDTPVQRAPQVKQLFDKTTKSYNSIITPGGVAEIYGSGLKLYQEEDPQQGVFLVREGDQETYRVEYYYNTSRSKAEFDVPLELGPGLYSLEFRSQYYAAGKTIRVGGLSALLENAA